MKYQGDFTTANTVYVYFNSYSSNDPAASITVTGLVVTGVEIYKNGSVTQRSSDAGYTLLDTDGIDFDGITGIHGLSIDLSDNTDAGFYAAGGEYVVVISAITIDAGTINFIAATFSIERAGGVLALLKGTNSLANIEDKIDIINTNVDQLETAVITNAAGVDIAADIIALKAETVLIVADTNELQTDNIPGLIAALNNISAAGVNAEVDTALADFFVSAAQLVDDFWNEVISKATHNVAGSGAKVLRQIGDLIQLDGSISDAGPTITDFDTDLTGYDDGYFIDAQLLFANGAANGGIAKPITGYTSATGNFQFASPDAWPITPVNTDDFDIVGLHVHPVDQIRDAILADSTPFNGASIAAILADTNETQSDDVPGLIAALNNISNANVLTQVNAAIDTAITELSVAAPTATPTIRTAIMLLYMMARNRVDVDTTGSDAMKIYNNAGTQIASKIITDDGTDYSEAEMS